MKVSGFLCKLLLEGNVFRCSSFYLRNAVITDKASLHKLKSSAELFVIEEHEEGQEKAYNKGHDGAGGEGNLKVAKALHCFCADCAGERAGRGKQHVKGHCRDYVQSPARETPKPKGKL